VIEIVFTVCTLTTAVCEQHSMPSPNELICLTQAQGEIVRTYPFRPGQVLARYGCSREVSSAFPPTESVTITTGCFPASVGCSALGSAVQGHLQADAALPETREGEFVFQEDLP
jgi:hypothetical protein